MKSNTVRAGRPFRTCIRPRLFPTIRPVPSSETICWSCRTAALLAPPQRFLSSSSSSRQSNPNTTNANITTVAPQTHYEFFPNSIPSGPPPAGPFAIDLRALRTEFLRLQAKTHPDLHPPEMKSRAEALSSRVNEAYKTLQDPLLRAQYLLSLQGIDVAEDETAKVDDQELLMAVLEAQEAIEEAREEGDLVGLREENGRHVDASVEVLEGAFAEGDLDTAKKESVKLRYWVNIGQGIKDWEPGKEVRLVH